VIQGDRKKYTAAMLQASLCRIGFLSFWIANTKA
jgi:hypothetical protein